MYYRQLGIYLSIVEKNINYFQMSGQKCSYYMCNCSKRNSPGLRTFSFPIKDPERCEKWVKNSGKNLYVIGSFDFEVAT